MEDTTKVTDENDVSGTNDKSETEGKLDTDTSNTQDNQEKRLTQSEVNEIVKRAKSDAERSAKTKFDKSLEGKIVLTEEERDNLIKGAVTAALKEEQLKSFRAKLQDEYGLNDYQVSKLEGDDEKSLREDAEKTYGKPRKQAPVLNGGAEISNDKQKTSLFAQQQQQKVEELKKKYHMK